MEGNGPLHGLMKRLGCLVFADDPVAADATCCRLMGIDPTTVPYLAAAAARHGSIASREVTIAGTAIAALARSYLRPPTFRSAKRQSSARTASVA